METQRNNRLLIPGTFMTLFVPLLFVLALILDALNITIQSDAVRTLIAVCVAIWLLPLPIWMGMAYAGLRYRAKRADKKVSLPAQARGWNWAAFLLGPLWGIPNGAYVTVLFYVLSPLTIIGMFITPFIAGAKGNEWAWTKKDWTSSKEFQSVQNRWAILAVIISLLFWPWFILLYILPA